jgi:hypothetical protein
MRCAPAAQRHHNNRMSATESRSYRPAIRIHDIFAEVERVIAGQPQLARGIELYLCRQTMIVADSSMPPFLSAACRHRAGATQRIGLTCVLMFIIMMIKIIINLMGGQLCE